MTADEVCYPIDAFPVYSVVVPCTEDYSPDEVNERIRMSCVSREYVADGENSDDERTVESSHCCYE